MEMTMERVLLFYCYINIQGDTDILVGFSGINIFTGCDSTTFFNGIGNWELASLTKWLNVRLRTKWFWVRVPLHSCKCLKLIEKRDYYCLVTSQKIVKV